MIHKTQYFTARKKHTHKNILTTRMWANAQCDGRPTEHRWRPTMPQSLADAHC